MAEASSGPTMITLRMIGASFSLSLRRLARSKLMLINLLLAIVPALIVILVHLVHLFDKHTSSDISWVHSAYEYFLRFYYLHFMVFFIANIFGFAVMRQETEERTLHYLLLQPVRRWMVIAGKLLAFLLLASGISVASLWLTYLMLALPLVGVRPVVADLFGAGRFVILGKESLVLVLGLLAYGSIAMLMGSFFKSGFYALLIFFWESGLNYLPSTLKLGTVVHYLHSLLPERLTVQKGLFEMLGDPASVPLSLGVLCSVSLVIIGIAIACFHFKECLYE